MKYNLFTLLLCCTLLYGCADTNENNTSLQVPDIADTVDTADTSAQFIFSRTFGEYDYYLREGYGGEARIMLDDNIVFEGSGTFIEVCGFPVYTEDYHNGAHTVFNRDFTPIADSLVTYGEMQDGSILAHRRDNGINELVRIDSDGSLHQLGEFANVYTVICEGDFALVSTCVQNESLSSVPYCTLTVVDKSGDTLAYLDKIEQGVRFMEIGGDMQGGMWKFTFSLPIGDGIIYNYYWNQRALTHRLEIEYPMSDASAPIPRKDDDTDYVAITETYSGVDCLFLDGDKYKCRRIVLSDNAITESVSDVEEWSGGALEGYKVLASAAHADHACWVLDENGTVVFEGCGIVSEFGGFPVFSPCDVQLPETFLTHDFKVLCDGVIHFEIQENGDIIARKADRLVRIGKDETVADMGEYDGRFDHVIYY